MIHIIAGEQSAKNLQEAFLLDENLVGELIILKDHLELGEIGLEEDKDHDAHRNSFWTQLNPSAVSHVEERSIIKLLIARAEREDEPICFWMAPNATDVCMYYWLLPYFKAYPGMLHTINIIGLPFLNEKGQLFYPTHFTQVPPKEFLKTKRLLKEVTPAEFEVEADEWPRLQEENEWLRVYEGGKKIMSKPATHFDALLKNSITTEFQKASKVISETIKKITFSIHPQFIEWRLRQLIEMESIICQGDLHKGVKDFEVKKVGQAEVIGETEQANS